jgi:hypothetical protein
MCNDMERAFGIVEDHADADMEFDELLMLLLDNDVPEDVAIDVASEVRG